MNPQGVKPQDAKPQDAKPRVIVGLSGASGAAIGCRIVERLAACGAAVHLVVSDAARRTLHAEIGPDACENLAARAMRVHDNRDIGADIASGSFPVAGMIVAPCSMRSLSAIAHSLSDNLLVRAADVRLKERQPLILLARETPLHLGHLRAMTAVTEMGAIVMPPVPAFYLNPASLDAVIDQIACRAIDLLRIFAPISAAWESAKDSEREPT